MKNIIMITGLSDSGKSYIADCIDESLRARDENCHVYDNVEIESINKDVFSVLEGTVLITATSYDPDNSPIKADRVIEIKKL